MKPSLLIFLSLVFVLLVPTARAQERPSETEFKGMELYSWQDSNGDWLFALLPGTNRIRSEAEIKDKENQIAGANELEKHFLRLAEGEQVFWSHRGSKGFAYPDEGTMKAIAASAQKAKIELHVPPKTERGWDSGPPPPLPATDGQRRPIPA
jgi:hypothetical protein